MAKKLNLSSTPYVANPNTEYCNNLLEMEELIAERRRVMDQYDAKIVVLSQKNKSIIRTCKHEFHHLHELSYHTVYKCIHCQKVHYEVKP